MLVTGGSGHQPPRWIRVAGAATAVCLLPFGLVYCGTVPQTIQTAPEESPESLPIAKAELIALVDLNRTDPRAAELSEPWEDDPGYSYWIFKSQNGDIGPLPLSDAPERPPACRLEPRSPDDTARDEALGGCTVAMSNQLRLTKGSDGGTVCVVWGSRAGGWNGLCDGEWISERDRLRENGADRESQELVVIHIGTTQSYTGSDR